MAVDAFLKIAEIKGESVVKGHEESMQVLSWSWGMSQSGTTHRGTGGGAGKANVQDMSISKLVDKASPNLMLGCCNGKHYKEAVLTLRKAGEKPLDYLVITMTDVLITSVQVGGSSGSDEVMESFSLNFAKFKTSYQPQDKTGAKAGGAIEVTYDIAVND